MADDKKKLRSQWWFDDPHDIGMTAMYVERYLNMNQIKIYIQMFQ